ncbi:MAG: hypothetical protein Q4B80_00935 [Aerococcaceae bacterium]|nr:hypothetical protein [Aerococcaceae bacterium]
MNASCLLCGERLARDISWQQLWQLKPLEFECICPKCRATFKNYAETTQGCIGCGRPFHEKTAENYCYDCQRWLEKYPKHFIQHTAILDYNDALREWLYAYKYQGDTRLATVMKMPIQQFFKAKKEAVCLVLPSSPKSLAERGFHATHYLLECANIPAICPFTYIGDGNKQAKKNRQERLALVQPFSLEKRMLEPFLEKEWWVFDDVYTTGTTLLKAKELLFQMKETGIHSVTLGRDTTV